jgi:iron(III) transport system permease protein
MARFLRPETLLGLLVSLIVGILTLPPLVAVLLTGSGVRFAPFHEPGILFNTLLFGFGTTVLAVIVGGGLALALAPGVPGRALLERLVVVPLYLTPLLTAMGWDWLASPRSGLLNLLLHAAWGKAVTINAVTPTGTIVVSVLAMAPLPFLLISDALRGIDASLTEAARVHGATQHMVVRRIVLPLLAPAGLASSVLVFVQAIGLFSVPAVLGMPAGFNVATTEIYQLLESYPPRIEDATAWGVLLLIVAAALMFAQSALLSRRSFVTITGKAYRPALRTSQTPRLRAGVGWLYVVLATVLPLMALLWAASVLFMTANWKLMRFSAQHFDYVLFSYPKTWLAASNSAILGALSATLVTLLGFAVSWIVLRTRQIGRRVIDQLSMMPLSMPAMVFALGLLWVYVRVPLPIYGTLGILLIAYVTHYLPFGVRATSAALRQLHPELEEAARVSGASWIHTMRRVTLPLVQPTMIAAWALLFIMAMQEVSASILLYTSRSIVLSVAVFDLWQNGNPSDVAALGFVQLAVSFVIVGLALRARQRWALA